MRTHSLNHPAPITSRGIMSCDEIRHWLREFYTRPELGWCPHTAALAAAVGAALSTSRKNCATLIAKVKGRGWIYPGEQVRYTRQLRLMLAGVLICRQAPGFRGQRGWRGVIADHPAPLKEAIRMRYDLTSGRLGYTRPTMGAQPMLPSFASVMLNPEVWNPR